MSSKLGLNVLLLCCQQVIHILKVKLKESCECVSYTAFCLRSFKTKTRYSELYILILPICTVIS